MTPLTVERLDALPDEAAKVELAKCCASDWWIDQMLAAKPYGDSDGLHRAADGAFDRMPREAWLESFASHPRIGDLGSRKMESAGNKRWSAGEQASVASAEEAVLGRLREGNEAYYERFGFVFLICATGKSAAEMLAELERRMGNDAEAEAREAADQQRQITHLRLDKLLASAG